MPQLKYQIVSRLLNGETPKAISEEFDVPYTKVLRLQRELKEAQLNNTVQEFIDIDAAMMEELVDAVKASTPPGLAEAVDKSMAVLVATKSIMDVLSEDFIMTAKALSMRIRQSAANTEQVSELDVLSDALCKLQVAFFNKNQTQVNVQNNYGQEPQYGAFLDDKPAN
jgi:uncharacterized Ntn-hydrolase superfamily protein